MVDSTPPSRSPGSVDPVDELLEHAFEPSPRSSAPWELPEQIGPFSILSILGEGGMGTVYLAEQREPVRRRVALKVIKPGLDSKQILKRFETERQALALMHHDNIAKVLEAGMTKRGRPFFVMEFVRGIPIDRYCDHECLSVDERLELFQQVCLGVQHAHMQGVMHRDLKPSNVLVSVQNGKDVPKIIDFGLARATGEHSIAMTTHTGKDQILGTPDYLSPEQAGLDNQDVDTRTDVYSLGVMLYQLLVGDRPFSTNRDKKIGLEEIRRSIREDDPVKPSSRLSSMAGSDKAAGNRGTDARSLIRRLTGDLDWVVMRAMEKDRNRRYLTAAALAEDISRHLAHEPVHAGPPSTVYRVKKFLQRYRVQAIAGALVLTSLLVGMLLFAIANARANENAAEAKAALTDFNRLADVVRLREAKAAEKDLVPAWPEKVGAMKTWLEQAEPLADRLPSLRETLNDLRAGASAVTTEQPQLSADTRQSVDASAKKPLESKATEADIPRSPKRRWRFEDQADQFLHDTLATLVNDLADFAKPETGEIARVRERLQWADKVEAMSITAHRLKWADARQSLKVADGVVASELYAEHPLDLEPQMGLVPLGMNQVTKLWEFYHLRSAADPDVIPEHGPDGSIEVTPETGIIFVLIPGGTFVMGAQNLDPQGTNYDPLAVSQRPREVTLEPWFLARHEMTQAQWKRLSGGDTPSRFADGYSDESAGETVTPSHPVEQVSWDMCVELFVKHALVLPSEALWEYACRAGTSTPWFTGSEGKSLAGYANVFDQGWPEENLPGTRIPEDFEDGYVLHAPVGSFLPNAFGIFDMHGNVIEWCYDLFDDTLRVSRGGAWGYNASYARSVALFHNAPSTQSHYLGVRPARAVR